MPPPENRVIKAMLSSYSSNSSSETTHTHRVLSEPYNSPDPETGMRYLRISEPNDIQGHATLEETYNSEAMAGYIGYANYFYSPGSVCIESSSVVSCRRLGLYPLIAVN